MKLSGKHWRALSDPEKIAQLRRELTAVEKRLAELEKLAIRSASFLSGHRFQLYAKAQSQTSRGTSRSARKGRSTH
jgi:hypothetical protein